MNDRFYDILAGFLKFFGEFDDQETVFARLADCGQQGARVVNAGAQPAQLRAERRADNPGRYDPHDPEGH